MTFINENRIDGATMLGNNLQLKPFVKWAGGKGQLLNYIRKLYPKNLGKTIDKYAEPFVGGGAVLFDILNNFDLREIYISDVNAELINAYLIIRDDVESLINILSKMEKEYIPLDTDARKLYYYEKRDRFNFLKLNGNTAGDIEKAAIFIFLNRTCFNGLYRVNKKGLYNVPMGAYKKPTICDSDNLKNISFALKKVTIKCDDYRECTNFVDAKAFVYFDPPYRPISETASFNSYTENLFDDKAQVELAEFVSLLDKKGAKIVVSNSDPKNVNEKDYFFDDLYKEHNINRVEAARMINCNGDSRGKISELLISNFTEAK